MTNSKLVLIVDDNEEILEIYNEILASSGINSLIFKHPKEALDFLFNTKEDINLLILDIIMPLMDGFEFLERIKELRKTKDFKVCLFSGLITKENISKAAPYKISDYLIKPVDIPVFLNKIRTLLEIRNVELTKDAFAQVNFQATIIALPILFNFEIIGLSQEGILLESICNFREQAILYFNSRALLDAIKINNDDILIKIIKTKSIENKFRISAVFLELKDEVREKIKLFINENSVSSEPIFL